MPCNQKIQLYEKTQIVLQGASEKVKDTEKGKGHTRHMHVQGSLKELHQ